GFVLDIDLDFFFTSISFLEIYKDSHRYNGLKKIFNFASVEALEKAATATIS
ncbi:GL15111, partial [Drosophila persimilis]